MADSLLYVKDWHTGEVLPVLATDNGDGTYSLSRSIAAGDNAIGGVEFVDENGALYGVKHIDNVNVTAGVPDTDSDIRAIIDIARNQTLMALWTVPNGCTAYVTSWWGSESSTKGIEIELAVRELGQVFAVKTELHIKDAVFQHRIDFPQAIPAKADIEVRAIAQGAGAEVSGGFFLWYETP